MKLLASYVEQVAAAGRGCVSTLRRGGPHVVTRKWRLGVESSSAGGPGIQLGSGEWQRLVAVGTATGASGGRHTMTARAPRPHPGARVRVRPARDVSTAWSDLPAGRLRRLGRGARHQAVRSTPSAGLVPRPRLVEQLNEGLERALILVCAPAGFGKTALLADWSQTGRWAPAWISLDAGDNDPARFWRHAIAALDRVQPGVAELTGPLFGPPAPPSFEGPVAALVNELAARPGSDEVVLVLDDYHVIDSWAVHKSVTFLLEHLPPRVHLVLSSRADPPLALARLRGRRQLAELRAADLRFTIDEAAALLRDAVGSDLPLPDTTVATLTDRTEGWAAGLQLAALSLRGRPDVTAFLEAFSGSHRYILDYLTEEVLERQPGSISELPAGDVDPGAAVGAAVRRRHRPQR